MALPGINDFDAVVVGAGMSGGWAAKELCEKGLKVLVLDRGAPLEHGDYVTEGKAPWEMEFRGKFDREIAKREQNFQRTSYLYSDYTRHYFINDRENPYEAVDGTRFDWFRTSKVGGKSLLWGRQSYRWGPQDFESNKIDGNGVDWPIRYEDLERWYDYVEIFAGISGNADHLSQLPDGKFQPPLVMNVVERHAKAKVKAAYPERDIIMARTAHLTAPTEEQLELGRSQCQSRNECARGCSFGAYFSSLSATLPAAERTGNMTLRANAMVLSVLYDEENDRAVGIRYIDTETHEMTDVTSRIVFMCASAINSLQILLNSRSARFPDGIGNSSGTLGHYVMSHLKGVRAMGDISGFEDTYHRGRRPNGIYIPRFQNLNGQQENFLRGYGFQGSAGRGGWINARSRGGIGADFKMANRKPGGWSFSINGRGEMLPSFDNHVRLSKTRTDEWGLPIVQLSVKFGENDNKIFADIEKTALEILSATGATNIKINNKPDAPGNDNHEMGGAPMGRDPKTSYLNRWNQNHDVANLFVTDGAAMSSCASQNPSLTYMAITARAADYAVKQMKAGKI
ncbi:MAG: GMC family oxidoreductase [Proteobacteria bacterium]|nr:GMC family oxidoreductase [Pseudomonadota bacterium]